MSAQTNRYTHILFDLDGTLLDTARDFLTATNQTLAARGREPISEHIMRQHVTDGSIGILRRVFDMQPADPEFPVLQQQFLAFYAQCLTDKTVFFPGLETSMSLLSRHQIPWGVVTNKPRRYAEPIAAQLLKTSQVLICPDDVNIAKPDPEGLLKAASLMGIAPERCLYAGDHERDIQAAKAANMGSIAVGWGYIDPEEDIRAWGADHNVQTPQQLQPLLRSLLTL